MGAPGQGATNTTAPIPPRRVDFEVNGDENNGWWWLRDAAGTQRASWGFFGVPAASRITLDLNLLATDAVTGGAGVDARFWLSYGAIVEGNVASAPGGEPVLVTLPNTSPPGDPVGYTASGSYTIERAELPAGALGVWVRIARAGPDGAVLPEHLAVAESSVRIAGISGPDATPPPPAATADVDFEVHGDEISGWWWLRDAAGAQNASWSFFGTPVADQVRLDMNLLATDKVSGGPFIDAQFWLTFRTIVEGGGGSTLSEPVLVILKNASPDDDPLGYATSGSFTIARSDIAPGAIGIWVGISRSGPDGTVRPAHIAVQAASMRISGLAGPTETAAPSSEPGGTPTPSPTSSPLYGPLTITTDCQEYGDAPLVVTGSAAPDLHLEFSPTDSFTTVFANEIFVLSPPAYTFESVYGVPSFPNGIWVRWVEAPSIKAYVTNKGYCPGWTPQPTMTPEPSSAPTPTPAPTWGPPAGLPTIVALGDSYISGEAGRWAGNTSDWYVRIDALGSDAYYDNATGTAEVISGCHRSESAEVHIDQRRGQPQVTTINLACSGATTQTRNPSGGAKPGIDNCPNDIHRTDCPTGVKGQGTMLTETALVHNVKLVVLSIGGNDFEFSDTVAQCAKDFAGSPYMNADFCYDDGSVIPRFSNANVDVVRAKLVNAYEDVVLAMRAAGYPDDHWSLLIQNYPGPIPPGGDFRYGEFGQSRFNNGCPFWSYDADWANAYWMPTISNAINVSVGDFSDYYTGTDVHVMDVSQAFIGHRLCEDTVGLVGSEESVKNWTDPGASNGSEWIAQIRGVWSSGGALPLPGSVYYKNESFHPNYWGQLALRNCLRQAYNNGAVRGGTCEFMQDGLNAFGEPQVILTQP